MTKLLWRKCRLCGVSEWKHVCPVPLTKRQQYNRKAYSKRQAKKQGMTDEEVRHVFGPIADVLAGRAP